MVTGRPGGDSAPDAVPPVQGWEQPPSAWAGSSGPTPGAAVPNAADHTMPGRRFASQEPRDSDLSAGEWAGEDVVQLIADTGMLMPSALWLLDPDDEFLVYGRWELRGEGLAQLRELNRRGFGLGSLPTLDDQKILTGWRKATFVGAQLIAIAALISGALWGIMAFRIPLAWIPAWPQVLLALVSVGLAAVTVGVAVGRRGRLRVGDPRDHQVAALHHLLQTRNVANPSGEAVSLALQIRSLWEQVTGGRTWARATRPQQDQWRRRVDQLLHALARSQVAGDPESGRELFDWAAKQTNALTVGLNGPPGSDWRRRAGASPQASTPPAATPPDIPIQSFPADNPNQPD